MADNYVFFWRLEDSNSYLGQWKQSPFITKSRLRFATAGQYMMYYKAITFDDFATAEVIYNTYNAHPSFHKHMGRQVKGFIEDKWKKVREDIVFKGNMYKFVQNKGMRMLLLETGDRILAEASPIDEVWGIGYAAENALNNIDNWKKNLLGKILMRVRDEIRDNRNPDEYSCAKTHVGFDE